MSVARKAFLLSLPPNQRCGVMAQGGAVKGCQCILDVAWSGSCAPGTRHGP